MRTARSQCGFSYTEVLVAVVLLGIALVPAMDSLTAGLGASAGYRDAIDQHYRLAGRAEEVLAMPFADLDAEAQLAGAPTTATALSDAPGTPGRRLVYLARYDIDDADGDSDTFTGAEDDFIWVRVELDGADLALEALRVR